MRQSLFWLNVTEDINSLDWVGAMKRKYKELNIS